MSEGETWEIRHHQHLTTDKLVSDFGLTSCDELTNITVNVKDKKLTPLDLTMKVHITVWRLQPGPPKDFQPIRNRPFNKESGVQTSSGTVLFFDWLVLILNYKCFHHLEWCVTLACLSCVAAFSKIYKLLISLGKKAVWLQDVIWKYCTVFFTTELYFPIPTTRSHHSRSGSRKL